MPYAIWTINIVTAGDAWKNFGGTAFDCYDVLIAMIWNIHGGNILQVSHFIIFYWI